MHWLWVHGGLSSPNSPWYLFWSGIGADWTRLLTLGGVVTLVRQHAKLKDMHERHHRELTKDKLGGTERPHSPAG